MRAAAVRNPTIDRLEAILRRECPEHEAMLVEEISSDRYASYRSIYKRAEELLERLGLEYEPEPLERKIGIFSIWLKAADDLIDSRRGSGIEILDSIISDREAAWHSNEPAYVLTEVLKRQIEPSDRDEVLHNIGQLYEQNRRVASAANAGEYIAMRKAEGELVADTISSLVRRNIAGSTAGFESLFRRIGALGNLIDSAIDFKGDSDMACYRNRLLSRARLYSETFIEAANLVAENPWLIRRYGSKALRMFSQGLGRAQL